MKDKKINYKPLNKSFLVFISDTTEGGIIIPKEAKDAGKQLENAEFLEVLKTSDDCETIKKGMMIVIGANARPALIKVDGIEYVQLREYEVVGIREE